MCSPSHPPSSAHDFSTICLYRHIVVSRVFQSLFLWGVQLQGMQDQKRNMCMCIRNKIKSFHLPARPRVMIFFAVRAASIGAIHFPDSMFLPDGNSITGRVSDFSRVFFLTWRCSPVGGTGKSVLYRLSVDTCGGFRKENYRPYNESRNRERMIAIERGFYSCFEREGALVRGTGGSAL